MPPLGHPAVHPRRKAVVRVSEEVQGPIGLYEPGPVRYMDIREFRDLGILQEANRLFFHPLGLALEVQSDGDNFRLSGIWDYRDDVEGVVFGDKPDAGKAKAVEAERRKHAWNRIELMGSVVQPLDWDPIPSLPALTPRGNAMGGNPATE